MGIDGIGEFWGGLADTVVDGRGRVEEEEEWLSVKVSFPCGAQSDATSETRCHSLLTPHSDCKPGIGPDVLSIHRSRPRHYSLSFCNLSHTCTAIHHETLQRQGGMHFNRYFFWHLYVRTSLLLRTEESMQKQHATHTPFHILMSWPSSDCPPYAWIFWRRISLRVTASAANLEIPSRSFSTAIWSSLK